MLKELFEFSFYQTYRRKSGVTINLREKTFITDFSLRDKKACYGCLLICNSDDSLREQLRVVTTTPIYVISVDDILENVEESVGENCDFILDDDSTVSLIEMTCSTTENVVSKRQKARRQLFNSLSVFFTNPDVRRHFESKTGKYVIFSWRDTLPSHHEDDLVLNAMTGMTKMSDALYSEHNVSNFDFGFRLIEIKYPYSLNWNTLSNMGLHESAF